MPKIKYDVSDVEDVADRTPAPVGIYRAKIVKAEAKPSKQGNKMIEVQLHLTHDAAGKKLKQDEYGDVWMYPILDHDHDYVKGQLKEFVLAVTGKEKGVLDTDKIVGTSVQVKLKSDTDQDGEYRPRVGKIMSLAEAEEPEEEDEDEEDGEEEGDDDSTDTYSEQELNDLEAGDLKEVAEENGVDLPAGKLTAAKRKKLVAAILEAQGEEDEEEDEEDEEDEDEGVDLDTLDRAALKKFIKDEELGITVKKAMSDDDLRAAIADAMGEDDGEEDEEEDEEEESEESEDYTAWSVADLKKELKERELNTSGSKKVLAARLKKDDESEPF